MRQHWATILMGFALAGLIAYVYLIELPTERAQTQTEAQEKKILPFQEQEITRLTVMGESGKVALAGKEGKWKITEPLETDADSRTVEAMIRALALGKVNRVVDETASTLAPFGLEKPSVVLTVATDTGQETLSLGDSGPISSTLYAMRSSDRKILLTDLAPKDFLNKSLITFRKKEVLRFDQSQVERLRLTYPPTEIVLYRTEEKDAKKKWAIRYPVEAAADQPAVRTLLMKLEDLKALSFIDPGPEQDVLMQLLKKPELKITVYAGGAEQTVKLFMPDRSSGEAYALTTPEAPIYRINPTLIKDLNKDLFALQDKRLLGVDAENIAMLAVKTRDEAYTLIRQNSIWVLEDKPDEKVDQEKAAVFVSRVADLPAELRIVKQAAPLTPYGLASPAAEFVATGKDGKQSGRLVLGTKAGGLVYATGKSLPGIYQARSDLLTQVPAKRELIQAPQGGT
jgi:hypothetical protein